MADKIEVNISSLAGCLSELSSLESQAKSNFSDMTESIHALNATWEGPAHTAFLAQYESDRAQMEETLGSMDKFLSAVEFAKTEYTNCERNVGSVVDSIQV